MRRLLAPLAALTVLALVACSNPDSVGKVGVDWTGNDIAIDAVADPKVEGVVCHVSYFNRSFIDRMQQGNWFEDPSNSAIDCTAMGPLTVGDISLAKGGEEIFKQDRSLIIKDLVINRIYDAQNNALIYLAHTRQVMVGSAKMSISVVPLNGPDTTWTRGRPAAR